MTARILIIAGSDSGGGAGIQGDIKTVTMMGGYAATAITALTAQNTQGVFGIHDVPLDFIRQQMELVLDDIGADALKTGMLSTADIIHTVATVIRDKARHLPFVLDPVMIAKGGAALLQKDAVDALVNDLLPLSTLLTPNIPEAELLAGMTIKTEADMQEAGNRIRAKGASAVLVKGGHREGDEVVDLLITQDGTTRLSSPRIDTTQTHGTGCTLASAIATGLAQNFPLPQAVERAREFVQAAIHHAPGLGKGHGPLGHNFIFSA